MESLEDIEESTCAMQYAAFEEGFTKTLKHLITLGNAIGLNKTYVESKHEILDFLSAELAAQIGKILPNHEILYLHGTNYTGLCATIESMAKYCCEKKIQHMESLARPMGEDKLVNDDLLLLQATLQGSFDDYAINAPLVNFVYNVKENTTSVNILHYLKSLIKFFPSAFSNKPATGQLMHLPWFLNKPPVTFDQSKFAFDTWDLITKFAIFFVGTIGWFSVEYIYWRKSITLLKQVSIKTIIAFAGFEEKVKPDNVTMQMIKKHSPVFYSVAKAFETEATIPAAVMIYGLLKNGSLDGKGLEYLILHLLVKNGCTEQSLKKEMESIMNFVRKQQIQKKDSKNSIAQNVMSKIEKLKVDAAETEDEKKEIVSINGVQLYSGLPSHIVFIKSILEQNILI